MKVLLATDGSAHVREAEWLLSRLPIAEPMSLEIVTVVACPDLHALGREVPAAIQSFVDRTRDAAQRLVDEEAERFEGMNAEVQTKVLCGHVADEVIKEATEQQSELIVVGARGMTRFQRMLIGSTSDRVAKHAPCSVLTVRPTGLSSEKNRPLRVVVGVDGSETSRRAVEQFASFHWGESVEIEALAVLPRIRSFRMDLVEEADPFLEQQRRDLVRALDQASSVLSRTGAQVSTKLIDAESIVEALLTVAEQAAADLIVVGCEGKGRIERFLMGSVSFNILSHAHCSVWIARTPETKAE